MRYNVAMRTLVSLDRTCSAAILAVFVFLLLGVANGAALKAEEAAGAAGAEPDLSKAEILAQEDAARSSTPLTTFSVSPVVANEKAKPRDIIKKELLVTNNTNERMGLRASVENIDPSDGTQEFVSPGAADLSQSLANWIEITRGVIDLSPGESRKIPYLIHVNLSAKPGSYFARVVFTDGTPPPQDGVKGVDDGTSLLINVEVQDDARERLQLGNFMTANSIVTGKDVSFTYQVENVGNRNIEPRGSIRIFNRRGAEVGSVPLNADGISVTPENKQLLAAAWDSSGRFGKYKAFLDLEYGENQVASVQDTVYFWVFPWKEIFMTILGVFVLALIGTYIIHLRTVARPVPIHSHQETAPLRAAQPYERPRMNVQMPSRENRSKPAPAVVAVAPEPRVAVASPSRGAPLTHGDTIELARRSNHSDANHRDSHVVQLSSRR